MKKEGKNKKRENDDQKKMKKMKKMKMKKKKKILGNEDDGAKVEKQEERNRSGCEKGPMPQREVAAERNLRAASRTPP